MNTYMVVATFKPNTDMNEVMAVVTEERAQVVVLKSADQLGSLHISLARGTIFLEIFAPDENQATAIVNSLPMARWWNLAVYPTPEPTLPNQASA
jgi:hypothetical protein